jgi:hypothetical protein
VVIGVGCVLTCYAEADFLKKLSEVGRLADLSRMLVRTGDFVDVPFLHEAGLAPANKARAVRLFLRQASYDIVTKLDTFLAAADLDSEFFLDGSPGAGKSTTVWLWLLSAAFEKRIESFLWIHMDKSARSYRVVCLRDGIIRHSGFPLEILKDDLRAIRSVDVCVFDGRRREDHFPYQGDAKCVSVASVSLDLKPHELTNRGSIKVTMDSWRLEEYMNACQDSVFWGIVKSNICDTGAADRAKTSGVDEGLSGDDEDVKAAAAAAAAEEEVTQP